MSSNFKNIWKSLTQSWFGFVFYAILGAVGALIIQSASGLALDTDFPIVTVSSGSMIPTLNVGDIAIVKGSENYEVGDILVFSGWRDRPIIHRVVATYDGDILERADGFDQLSDNEIERLYDGDKIYITKGDNPHSNPVCDQCTGKEAITHDDIHGREIAKIPYIGIVKIWVVQGVSAIIR